MSSDVLGVFQLGCTTEYRGKTIMNKVIIEMPCPILDEQLIQHLKQRFPERSPSPGETLDDLRHRGGQASVVRYLENQFLQQQETDYVD